jgi:hypothetical protein
MTTRSALIKAVADKAVELLEEGDVLKQSLQSFGWQDNRPGRTKSTMGPDISALLDETPATSRIPSEFVRQYHSWYSSCLAFVEVNMPSRVAELERIHDNPKDSKFTGTSMITVLKHDVLTYNQQLAIAGNVTHIAAIVESVPHYLESRLYDVELAIAQLYVGDELAEVELLLKSRHVRAAGAVAGVLLERHLKLLCDRHQPPLKYNKSSTISKLNDTLRDHGVYGVAQWRKVQWMGDIRNSCDHANTSEPRQADVADLVAEVKKFVALFVL